MRQIILAAVLALNACAAKQPIKAKITAETQRYRVTETGPSTLMIVGLTDKDARAAIEAQCTKQKRVCVIVATGIVYEVHRSPKK